MKNDRKHRRDNAECHSVLSIERAAQRIARLVLSLHTELLNPSGELAQQFSDRALPSTFSSFLFIGRPPTKPLIE